MRNHVRILELANEKTKIVHNHFYDDGEMFTPICSKEVYNLS